MITEKTTLRMATRRMMNTVRTTTKRLSTTRSLFPVFAAAVTTVAVWTVWAKGTEWR